MLDTLPSPIMLQQASSLINSLTTMSDLTLSSRLTLQLSCKFNSFALVHMDLLHSVTSLSLVDLSSSLLNCDHTTFMSPQLIFVSSRVELYLVINDTCCSRSGTIRVIRSAALLTSFVLYTFAFPCFHTCRRLPLTTG